jgi:hypothetical protein
MARMKRLQISLEYELDEELGRVARRNGVSKAEVVRRCLKNEIEPRPSLKDDPLFQMFGTLTEAGKGLRPGESIDDAVYGRKARDDLR